MLNLNLKDKVVLITGASKGMGFEIAQAFSKQGSKVFLISRNIKNLKSAVDKIIRNGGTASYLRGDVADPKIHVKVFNKCKKKFGGIDILINNAGGPPMGTIFEHEENIWQKTIQTNMLSVVRFTKNALKDMKKKKWGRIITITSTLTKEPSPEMILSATSRGGLSAFNKAICLEFAKYNITSNIISPGGVLTERLKNLFKEKSKRLSKKYSTIIKAAEESIPTKRFAEPKEIANVILFLCSDHGAYINGINLSVDGGLTRGY
jgi:3-oxoacyl-[acyl-carrier protein] reductase